MSDYPTPRSLNQIVGDMLNALLSDLWLGSLPPGDPILSIIEAAAQSDLRTAQDIFQLLNSMVIEKASGSALKELGAQEDLEMFPESASSGLVNITDTSFQKMSSSIFHGTTAPIVGSLSINVVDTTGWPSSGSVYIGRGTGQYEGPLDDTSITDNTSHYTINLSGGNATQKFHNLGET